MKTRGLPKSVFEKSNTYWLVRTEGAKRVWVKLSRVRDGLPALYKALAEAMAAPPAADLMPAVIAAWQDKVMPSHAEKTQRDDRAMCKRIAEAFPDFTAAQVEPPDVAAFLDQFEDKPRSYNAYRGMLRELMRFAESRGHRREGSNPVVSIRTKKTSARERYITDSELRRIKVAAMRWTDRHGGELDSSGKKRIRPSGPMLCALIDMAVLTGQRIGDLLRLEWSAFGKDGVQFKQQKTGAKVLIEWSPKLKEVEARLRAMRKERRGFIANVFTTQDGKEYSYWGATAAWRRAVKKAGMADTTFHDLRAKAGTEKEAAEGMQEARILLGHTTENQTKDYVRNKSSSRTKATR